MKILIRESKRDILAKKQLTKRFPDLDVDEDDYRDSTGVHKRLEFSDDSGVIMVWSDSCNILYICYDVCEDLEIFTYATQNNVNSLIGQWFSETFDLPVEIVRLVPKFSLKR